MLTVATAAVLAGTVPGTLPAALGGLDGIVSPGMASFALGPRLDGNVVIACNGLSPVFNTCGPAAFGSCPGEVCQPDITGTLGYTGTITATIRGLDNNHLPVYVAETCQYVAGTRGNAGSVRLGGCSYSTDAPYVCGPDGCKYRMNGPWTLDGLASPPLTPIARPVGPWQVQVLSS